VVVHATQALVVRSQIGVVGVPAQSVSCKQPVITVNALAALVPCAVTAPTVSVALAVT
jgi:hypothetical protein